MQHINLLNPHLLTPHVAFSSRTIGWAMAGVLLAGLAAFGWAYSQAAASETTMLTLQSERDAMQAELEAALASDQADESGMPVADTALSDARARLVALTRLADALGQTAGPPASSRFQALSRARVEGVWLTGMHFGTEGFQLEGRAIDPARIPDYLATLERQPELSDLRIEGFGILSREMDGQSEAPAQPGRAFIINPQREGQP